MIDGADAARFLRWVCEAFEQPFVLSLLSRARATCPSHSELSLCYLLNSQSSAPGPADTRRRSTPRTSGCRSRSIDPAVNPGGVCLYRGCIPSKALLHVAEVLNEAKHAEAWGVSFGAPKIDLDRLRAFKTKVVNQLTGGLGQLSKQRKITYVQGTAAFVDAQDARDHDARTARTDTLTFEHAIIATGSHPAKVPGLSIDSPRVMDSTAALDLPDIPKSLLVVGGGYIGLELGSVYAALGTKVTVVEMTGGLLPGADRDLVNILAKRIETICEAVLLNTKVVGDEGRQGRCITVDASKARGSGTETKEQTFDRVLVSIGRRPNPVPGIEQTGVVVNQRGFIEVNATLPDRRAVDLRHRRRRR